MRPLLTHALVIVFSVTSLSAASRLNNSEGTRATNSVRSHRAAGSKSHASRDAKRKIRPRQKHRPYEIGRASWYGKRFYGKKTASGETYDMFQFTAAHQKLPLGTLVKVTVLRNGRWVIVRVNDRGPVPRSRIIDLSYGAAQVLGLRSRGVATVRLDIVQPETVAQNQPAPGDESEIAGLQ